MASTVLPNGIIIPEKYSRDWYNDLYHNWQELDNLLGGGGANDGTLTIQKNGATVGTFSANQATDETIDITVPDVNNGTLTIQQNGTTVDTFTANSSTDKTVDITVPTKTSDLTNDSNFVPSTDLATVATSGSYNDLSNKPAIPTVNNATLTIQKNGTNVQTFTANQSTNATANIIVPTKTSDLTNDSGFITSDNTKIPLAGSNQISGSLIPATDNSIDIGSSTNNIKMLYTKGIIIDGTQFLPSDYIPKAGGNVITGTAFSRTVNDSSVTLCGGTDFDGGASITLNGKNLSADAGEFKLEARNGTSTQQLIGKPDGNLATSFTQLIRNDNYDNLTIYGGTGYRNAAALMVRGKDYSGDNTAGGFSLFTSGEFDKWLTGLPSGTLTWNGQPIQYASDKRLKQQISEIDDKLLDAWQDVDLVQFKYNDAVKEKSDNARLHTGYVVQQIDSACKSHGVDISAYGLYCHEEYPHEVEEIEVEQADGTKTKETRVIREASEHYSLRYTEVYAVECMYLRRCIARLTARIEELEKGNNSK